MEHKDYYRILGLPPSASGDDIRRAYRRLARRHHPDRNEGSPESEERLKEINEAYRVLGDPDRKKDYDRSAGRSVPVRVGRKAGASDPVDSGKRVTRSRSHPLDPFLAVFARSFARGGGGGPFGSAFPVETDRGKRSAGRKGPSVVVKVPLTEKERREGGEREIRYRAGGRWERLVVRIPPGLSDGETVRMAGRGEVSPWGGPPGDLVLVICRGESAAG
ncbi:DnaJ domain-containing protein [Desulfacinum hydrothermale DSM 13146]|uniref:DnaJ domain-containing protein n=1 Tax=Desulfacinum hydrothermale DSM 13146 TaxID=1121390 RepID=A0A1W1X706_9BACT|nr:DnaJ domain-containing protein [Desulfacinum hydrothermale]SMC19577.1 DnaJ domain-containing protein [Desulfacinum hydrothermale DSM 13146]